METTPRNNLDNRLCTQLVCYGLGAAAIAAVAAPVASDAAVNVTNAGDITGDQIFFDLQGGSASTTSGLAGATDFRLYINPGVIIAKPAIAAYSAGMAAVLAVPNSNPFSPYAPRLNGGDTVGASGQSFFGNARFDGGQWATGSRGFLGLELINGGNNFYGWADVTWNNFGGSNTAFTLHGFGFDDVAGEAVTIPGAVPENTSTAMLLLLGAAGVAGLRAMRSRRAEPVA